MQKKKFAHQHITQSLGDRSLIFTILFLLAFGLIMIYNSTSIYSQDTFGGAYRFVALQFAWIIVGLLGFYFFYNTDYRKLKKFVYPLFFITIVTLGLLALFGILPCSIDNVFMPCINGANRWFYLNPAPLPRLPLLGVLGFQPSELAKLTLVMYLSYLLNSKGTEHKDKAFGLYLVTTGLIAGLVFLQPNMSTAVLLFLIGTFIYFAGGFNLKPLTVLMPVLFAGAIAAMLLSPYRRERLMTYVTGTGSDEEMGYHIKQVMIALGSGGTFGVGIGQSRQKFQYLPETSADSIFAIIGEELGFIGTLFTVSIFMFLLYRGFKIAQNAPDNLGKMLAVGISVWIGLQFFVNVAAMTKLIPLTGVPIPLISYGGSSMFFSLMGLGILANVSKYSS